jgi:integrase
MATFRDIKRKGGIRHVAQVYLGVNPTTRQPKNFSKTFATLKEAEQWARSIEVKRDNGTYRPTVTKGTLAQYLANTWLPFYSSQVRSTYNAEKVLGKWIINAAPTLGVPLLGRVPLRNLTAADFTALYLALDKKHDMQYRGIQHLHGLVRRALKHAVEQGELPGNPTDFAKLPKPDARAKEVEHEEDEADVGEVKYLTPDQAKRFREAAQKDRWCALWLLLLDAGLRPGEALALKWRHIDFDSRMVKVRTSLTRIRGDVRKERGQGWIVTDPKTTGSKGDVPVRAETMKALKDWKVEQNKQRLQLGREWQDHGFVFTTETGSPLGNNIRRVWINVMREADGGRGDLGTWGPEPKKPRSGPTKDRSFNPRFSVYVLRHTCATVLLLLGVDLLTVSRRLRHKNISITARFYGHVTAAHTTAAPDAFDRLFASVAS